MKLSVSNFLKVKTALIDVSMLALVCGQNEQGKSSIATALGMLLTRNSSNHLTKKQYPAYVEVDAEKSAITLEGGEGVVSFYYPSGEVKEQVGAPRSSALAAGMVRLSRMKPDERRTVLTEALNIRPTKEEYLESAARRELWLADDMQEKLWNIIDSKGFDAAIKMYQEHAVEKKSEWRSVTGEQWGEVKAREYDPVREDVELAWATSRLSEINILLEDLKNVAAIDEAGKKMLREKVALLPDLAEKLKKANDEYQQHDALLQSKKQERATLPASAEEVDGIPCPHCKAHVIVKKEGGKTVIEKADTLKGEQLKEMRLKIAGLDGEISRIEIEVSDKKRALEAIKIQGKAAADAKAELDKMEKSAPKGSIGDADDLKKEKAALEEKIGNKLKKEKAHEINTVITQCAVIQEFLGEKGLRQEILLKRISDLNQRIDKLRTSFGIKEIEINEQFGIVHGGFPVEFNSASAKFKVDCVFQLAAAQMDQSDCAVIDGADIIVGRDRGGLIKMCLSSGIPCLITLAIANPDKIMPLGKLGKTYWIENGITQEK